MLIDALRSRGVIGIDDGELVDMLSELGVDEGEEFAEDHDWSAEVAALRSEGLVEDVGCTWVRLSLTWWTAHVATRVNLNLHIARRVVEELAGAGDDS